MRVILLCGKGQSSLYMYNGIKSSFKIHCVIQEDKVRNYVFLRKRVKKLGFIKVLNQVCFRLLVPKFLSIISKKRIKNLKLKYNLNEAKFDSKVYSVSSVNSEKCKSLIKSLDPDIVIVNGTRIIKKSILNISEAIFINTHVGITPEYRGVHGAYWALVNKDLKNCGVTIHMVDAGIDTGAVIVQSQININKNDNFLTYTLHQYGVAIKMMKNILNNYKRNGTISCISKEEKNSKLWYHPTLTDYLYNVFFRGVK